MSDAWTVQVSGQNYGPYPLERMQAFIAEGRIVAKSMVAYGTDLNFHFAGDDLVLGRLLNPAPEPVAGPQPEPETGSEIAAEPEPLAKPASRRIDPMLKTFGNLDDAVEPSHVLIMTDMRSRATNDLEEAICSLGPAYPIMPQVWLVTTTESVYAIRKMLSQHIGSVDPLFVIDTTHDKASWHNFGPEPDARIHRVWGKDASQRKTG